MTKSIFLLFIGFIIFSLEAKKFKIVNNTDVPLKIFWKSDALQHEMRSNNSVLQPGEVGQGETFEKNCVQFFSAQTEDGRYRVRIKPFCKNSKLTIDFKDVKSILVRTPAKKLVITIEELSPEEVTSL